MITSKTNGHFYAQYGIQLPDWLTCVNSANGEISSNNNLEVGFQEYAGQDRWTIFRSAIQFPVSTPKLGYCHLFVKVSSINLDSASWNGIQIAPFRDDLANLALMWGELRNHGTYGTQLAPGIAMSSMAVNGWYEYALQPSELVVSGGYLTVILCTTADASKTKPAQVPSGGMLSCFLHYYRWQDALADRPYIIYEGVKYAGDIHIDQLKYQHSDRLAV
jgi:hypothetical protein